jgi:hypothetical protein
MFWCPEDSYMIGVLIDLLQGTPDWERRYDIAWYVSRCESAGFCDTGDQIRACAERYIAGKRKVTPPGTKRRKRVERERRKILRNIPAELVKAISEVIAENAKAIQQYKDGNEKAINSMVGGVMKRYRGDPAVIKILLIQGFS